MSRSRTPGWLASRLAWLAGVLLWLCATGLAQAQTAGSPFTCDVVFYQLRNNGTNSLPVKFAAVNATITPTAVYTATRGTPINSIGYNPVDNYIYGLRAYTGTPQMYRIGQTGYELVGTVVTTAISGTAFSAGFQPTGGVFDAAGRYYFVGQGGTPNSITPTAVFRVDFIPASGTVEVAHVYNLNPTFALNFGDFDFNGAGGPAGLLLGATGTVHHRLTLSPSSSDPRLGTASLTTATIPDVGSIGSAFYDAFVGKFYVFNNTNNDFWEITNPAFGVPGTVLTEAAAYVGPPTFAGPYSPTDGTSCPISGSRIADLAIQKSDGVTTATVGSVTSYNITVTNAGPYPANYSTVRDPAASGLQKLSVTCTAPGGPPTASCPATLSTTTFEAGATTLGFPPGTTLVFTVNALVTGAVSTNVTNTATVTPAIDTTDPNLANNTAVDVNTVNGSNTVIVSGAQQCPAGTAQLTTNLFSNGDFALASPFLSDATTGALNSYNTANSVSRQTDTRTYLPVSPAPHGVIQNPFPGDPGRSVPASNSWLLSNGKTGAANYRVWYQGVSGLTVGRVYQFMVYVSNATAPGSTSATIPDLRLSVSGGVGSTTVASLTFANETVDTWRLLQGTFTATATAMTLSVANFAAASAEPGGGDVAALAQATLRACMPSANVRVSKTDGVSSVVSTGTTAYTVTVSNPSSVTATTTLITDPAVPNFIKGTITCVASAGSTCPATLTILALEGSGLTIPVIGVNSTVSFSIRGTVTGPPGNTITNIVNVQPVGYTDPDLSDNEATDIDGITGTALLSVTKTNAVTVLQAGGTTSYTVTVSNLGPSVVTNALFKDPAITGLSCTAVTCTVSVGAAYCPDSGTTTVANMQGAGIPIPSLGVPSSVAFRVDCGVTASGQ